MTSLEGCRECKGHLEICKECPHNTSITIQLRALNETMKKQGYELRLIKELLTEMHETDDVILGIPRDEI